MTLHEQNRIEAYMPLSETDRRTPSVPGAGFHDRMMRQAVGRATGGLAPSVLAGAMLDWALQMAASPGRQAQLAEKALQHAVQLSHPLGATKEALPQDRRFASPLWDLPPWNRMRDSFLLTDDCALDSAIKNRWWPLNSTVFG